MGYTKLGQLKEKVVLRGSEGRMTKWMALPSQSNCPGKISSSTDRGFDKNKGIGQSAFVVRGFDGNSSNTRVLLSILFVT